MRGGFAPIRPIRRFHGNLAVPILIPVLTDFPLPCYETWARFKAAGSS